VLPQIRDAINRRYELIPYFYELCFRSSTQAQPIQRWIGWEPYDADPEVWTNRTLMEGETQIFLGDAFLVGGVFEQHTNQTQLYLPTCEQLEERYESYYNDGFISVHPPYEFYLPGQWITIPTPLSNIAVLARVGAVVPVGRPWATTASPNLEPNLPADDWRGVEIYPPPIRYCIKGRVYVGRWREDDGVSNDTEITEFDVSYEASETSIRVRAMIVRKGFNCRWGGTIWVILPVGEKRRVNELGNLRPATDLQGRYMYPVALAGMR